MSIFASTEDKVKEALDSWGCGFSHSLTGVTGKPDFKEDEVDVADIYNKMLTLAS